MILPILLQLILILCNAFFAATEIAVISLNPTKVRARAEEGDKKAVKMLKMIEKPNGFLSTIQIGITLAGFLGSAFAAENFAALLSGWLAGVFGLSAGAAGWLDTVSVVLITLILSFFSLVLGELVPKRLAMKYSDKMAEAVCGFITFLSVLLTPLVWLLSVTTNGVLRLFRINPDDNEKPVSEEDIVVMLDAGAEEGTLTQDNIEYIKNVFELDNLTASDVMTPRNAMETVTTDMTEEELFNLIDESGYSRLPVEDTESERIVGILHVRDYLLHHDEEGFELSQAITEPTYVPETIHLDKLFRDMQSEHDHIVIVVDEYGGTAGLLTMEDILEELVGEIWDEQDEEIENIRKVSDDTFSVLSVTPLDEFFEFFDIEPEECESATVNGWVTEHSGAIPEVGYSFTYGKLTVTVTAADEMRSEEVSVKVAPEEKEE